MFDVLELRDGCLKAAGSDVGFASDDELFGAARGLWAARAALDAADLHVLAELEVRGSCDRVFGLSMGAWLAHETGGDPRVFGSRVKVARKLKSYFGAFDDALSAGSIGFEHAQTFCRAANRRIVDDLAAEQDDWITKAADRPFKVWDGEVRGRAELLDCDGPFDPQRSLVLNRLALTPVGTTGVMFTGELHGEYAVGFVERIETRANELWRQAIADHGACPDIEVPPYSTLLALALEELTRQGVTADTEATSAPVVDFGIVHNDNDPDVISSVDGDIRMPIEHLAHLLCDARMTAMAVNVAGVLLSMGRTVRYATPAQRRALGIRDGGCVFPGCDRPASWCDAHHVTHWEHDGNTNLPNLALLCRHHHGVTHRQGWVMTATNDQHFDWTTPTGHTLHSQRHRGHRPPPSG
jgi:hypothetical protein